METTAPARNDTNQMTLHKFASRNFIFSLVLFAVLIAIIVVVFMRSKDNMLLLEESYQNQFQMEAFKSSLSNVMLPLNDYTLTSDEKNFVKLKSASSDYKAQYTSIKLIPNLSDENMSSLSQVHELMSEVMSIANDVADGKIPARQAGRVTLLAQSMVLTAQQKLDVIISALAEQLKQNSMDRAAESEIQFYILLGFILVIVVLLEFFNRRLLKRAHTVSEVSTNVALSAGNILNATEQQASLTDKHARSVEKISLGLEQIAEAGEKITLATIKIGKAADSTASLAKSGANETENAVAAVDAIQTDIKTIVEKNSYANERAEQIMKLMDSLRDIAEESQLLSLNASIDVSSASVSGGQSSSEIANEMRKMSDRTSELSNEIHAIVRDVHQSLQASAHAAQDGIDGVGKCEGIIQNTSDILQKMQTMSEKTSKSVDVIAQATSRQNERSQGFLKALQHVSGLLHISETELLASQEASARLNKASEELQKMS